ncbi:MAG: PEP-CTERM sorting domain-containing protein [Candidatus Thiodiazotropha sp. 6PDIVS]
MKKLIESIAVAGSLLLSPLVSEAALITHYDIDFSSPTHTVGSAPSIGSASDQISRINFGTPTVESTFAGLSDPSLHFNANTSTYEQIQLDMGQGYDNYQINFDFFSSNLNESNYAFTLHADTPQVRNLSFNGRAGVRYFAPFVQPINAGDFADTTSYHVTLEYDLAVGSMSFWLNNGLMGTRSFSTSGEDIESFRFSLSPALGGTGLDPSINVNLDNVLVTSRTTDVPEPSTHLLFFLGFIGLASMRSLSGASRKG